MDGYDLLACPRTGAPLRRYNDRLEAGGVSYRLSDGVADLIDPATADPEALREAALFETIPLAGISYFRPEIYKRVCGSIAPLLPSSHAPVCAEIGGGEGWFARAFLDAFPGASAFVCDVARRPLTLADPRMVRIRADARLPFLQPDTLDVAAFWVSLHHFPVEDFAKCLTVAAGALRPGGVLLVFEPSNHFLPRRLFNHLPIRHLVYYDDDESGVDLRVLTPQCEKAGFRPVSARGLNPPYAVSFLKHFHLWPMFWIAVEALHRLDRHWTGRAWWRTNRGHGPLALGSYLLALYRKDSAP